MRNVRFIEFLAASVQHRPRLLGTILVLVTIVTGLGIVLGKPRPNWEDAAKGAGRSNIQREDLSAFDLRGSDCFLVVEVNDLYRDQTVAQLRKMVTAVEGLDAVANVNWLDRVPVTNVFGLPEPLLPPDGSSAQHFRDAKKRVSEHPLVAGQLISLDHQTLLMPITLDWLAVSDNADCSANILATARASLSEQPSATSAAEGGSGKAVRVRLTGAVPLFVEYQTAFDKGHRRYMIIATLVSFLLAVVIFRGFAPVLIVVGAPVLGVFWTEGLLRWIHEPSNPLGNVVLPVLLIMVGMTDAVHLLMQIRRARLAGMDAAAAAANGVRHVGMACLLTSVTTAIGFGSLTLAESELVKGFGRACALGVATTFFTVVLVVPLMSMTFLGRRFSRGSGGWSLIDSPWLDGGWIGWLIQRRLAVSAFGFLLAILLASVAGQLRPDEKMSSYQPETSEAFQALHHCDEAFGGLDFIQVRVKWDDSVDLASGDVVSVVAKVDALLAEEELLSPSLSLAKLLASFPGDSPIEDRMAFVALMPDDLKRFFIREDAQLALVSTRVQDLGIAVYQPVFARLDERLALLQAEHAGFEFDLAGVPIRRGRDLFRIVWDLVASLGTASLVILAVMTIAFRSWRIGLVTILPNTLPLAVTGAILYAMGEA